MRVPIGVRSLHADSNPHNGTGRGATIYRFISDQFASFYLKVINTNARDALYVLDGLLHHETDLMIEEHYSRYCRIYRPSFRINTSPRFPLCTTHS